MLLFKNNNNHKKEDTKCWWRHGETRSLVHCWWGCKMVQLLWKSSVVPQKVKVNCPGSSNSDARYAWKQRLKHILGHECSQQPYSQEPEGGKPSSHRWMMGEQNVVYPYNGMLSSHKKEWNSNTYYNMDKLRKHYGKGNVPDKKGHLLHDSTCMKYLEEANS